ncbi:MAG: RnfABCDGE type electron transport complex subunit D, partial [Angelakisella sp.]
PMPFSTIPVIGEITTPLYSSAAYTLYVGGIPRIDPSNMILGLSPGPMGTTNILVLLACMLYLVLRRTVRIQQPFFMLLAVAGVAWFFPRTSATPLGSVFFELTAVPTIFFAAFMFSDPVTTPARGMAKAFYAVASGLVLMAFRYLGGYEFMAPFALLAMNALTPVFDMVVEAINTQGRRMAFGTAKLKDEPDFGDEEESED